MLLLRTASTVLAAAFLLPAGASALPPERREWIELGTGDLRLLSDAGERKTTEIARGLAAFHRLLAPWAEATGRSAEAPREIVVFQGEASFGPYSPARPAPFSSLAGYVADDAYGTTVALNAYPRYESEHSGRSYFGVYADSFFHRALPVAPRWLREGLADYYGTFAMVAGEAQIGAVFDGHAEWLEHHRFLPWEELLAATDEETGEGLRAQAWLLVHYLLHAANGGEERFAELLARAAEGDGEAALRDLYGLAPASLDTPLRRYVNGFGYRFRTLPLGELGGDFRYTVRQVPRPEVLVRLGELLLRRDEAVAAGEHFRAALRLDPDNAEAYTGLARLARAAGDAGEAETLLERAVALDPAGSRPYLTLADLLLTRQQEADRSGGDDPGLWRRARALLETAAGREPALALREALLGVTYLYADEDPGPGIAHLESARQQVPDRPELAYNLAQLHLRQGEVDAARRLLVDLRKARPALAATLERAIERELLASGRDAARAGDAEAVEAIAREHPTATAALTEALAAMAEETRERSALARYDHALELFDHGQLQAALGELHALLAGDDADPELRREAAELAAEIEGALAP